MAVSSVLVEACLVCKHHFGICARFRNMLKHKRLEYGFLVFFDIVVLEVPFHGCLQQS